MGKKAESDDVDTLRRHVEWALRNSLDAESVLPMLAKLARSAEPESEAWVLAHRHLAELALSEHPWRSSLFARRVVKVDADDDGAWAVLGLSQTLLGNYRYAASAYRRAMALSPQNPWYAHNLGHLLDVALGRPQDALPLLSDAYRSEPEEGEIAASYAHALARVGKLGLAKKVLKRVVAKGATAEQMILWRWLEKGAPAASKGTCAHAPAPESDAPGAKAPRAERAPRRRATRGGASRDTCRDEPPGPDVPKGG